MATRHCLVEEADALNSSYQELHLNVLGQGESIIITHTLQIPALLTLPAPALPRQCITGGISTSFRRGEEECLSNCVERFLDTSIFLVVSSRENVASSVAAGQER